VLGFASENIEILESRIVACWYCNRHWCKSSFISIVIADEIPYRSSEEKPQVIKIYLYISSPLTHANLRHICK
jgi:hypothetical protein